MAAINEKIKIIQLHSLGLSYSQIQDKTIKAKKSIEYIERVIEEYNNDGTISVNSKLNRIK